MVGPEKLAEFEKKQPGGRYREAQARTYSLPPVGMVAGEGNWRARREELLDLFQEHVYGRAIPLPDRADYEVQADRSAMDGAATLWRLRVRLVRGGAEHAFGVSVFVPNHAEKPVPGFVYLNILRRDVIDATRTIRSPRWPAEELIGRGIALAAFQHDDLAPDRREDFGQGVLRLYPELLDGEARATAIQAWAFGASRCLDALATVGGVDVGRIGVVGHSRGGKAALLAGALDERFVMVVSNESGRGGAAITRRGMGETVELITRTFPHWFCPRFRTYADRVDDLPVDQHQLLALTAPRKLYVASAEEDLWADPRGEYLSWCAAAEAWPDVGKITARPDVPPNEPQHHGPLTYHVRPGGHDLTPWDWHRFADGLVKTA